MNAPRGIRNNNPSNIHWGDGWYGLVSQNQRMDKKFYQFCDPMRGISALVKILLKCQASWLEAVESIINRYVSFGNNSTAAYIQRICHHLAVLPKQAIVLTESALKALIKTIIAIENGLVYYNYYSINLIVRAIKLGKE